MEVIGRESELAAVAGFLDVVPEGPAALILEGEAGIGKTTIWRAAVDEARERGFVVLSAQASGSETKLSFTTLSDLLEEVPDECFSDLPAPQRRALDIALLRQDAGGARIDWRAVSLGLIGVMQWVSRAGPALLAIDDLQWVDVSSARALEFAVRRLRNEPIGLLASARTSEQATHFMGFDRSLPADRLRRYSLTPLATAELGQLITHELGLRLSRTTLVRIHATCAGNPFFGLEIARALQRRGAELTPGEPLPLPESVTGLVAERLATLPRSAGDVLAFASAASQPIVPLLEAVIKEPGRVARGLTRAEEAGILEVRGERVLFTHPLLAAGVYSGILRTRKRSIHKRLAEVATDKEERARHLALAVASPESAVASELEGAAESALDRGAPEAAADLLETAGLFTPAYDVAVRSVRITRSAKLRMETGEYGRARDMLEALVPIQLPGRDRALLLLRLAEVRIHDDSIQEGEALLNAALEEAGDDAGLAARVRIELARVRWWCADPVGHQSHIRAAAALARMSGDKELLSMAQDRESLGETILGHGPSGSPLDRLGQLRESISASLETDVFQGEIPGFELLWTEQIEKAGEWFRLYAAVAEEHGFGLEQGAALGQLGEVEVRLGVFEEALAHILEAANLVGEDHVEVGAESYRMGLVLAYLGRIEEAREAATRGLFQADLIGALRWRFVNLAVLGFIELSQGDGAAAHRYLGEAVQIARTAGIGEPGMIRFVPDEIEALISLGELDEAKEILEWFESISSTTNRASGLAASARCRALLLASLRDMPSAIDWIDRALAQHERIPEQPFELGRTLLVKGEIHRRAKQKLAGRQALEEALRIFERLKAPLWAEKARAELARISGRTVAPQALTETERRVAELAAEGRTNNEIAAELFITPRTVAWNLSKVYRKLATRSRTEMARRLGAS